MPRNIEVKLRIASRDAVLPLGLQHVPQKAGADLDLLPRTDAAA